MANSAEITMVERNRAQQRVAGEFADQPPSTMPNPESTIKITRRCHRGSQRPEREKDTENSTLGPIGMMAKIEKAVKAVISGGQEVNELVRTLSQKSFEDHSSSASATA